MIRTANPGDPISAAEWNALPVEVRRDIVENCIRARPPLFISRAGGDTLTISYEGPGMPTRAIESFEALPQGAGSGYAVIRVKQGTVNDFADGAGLTVLGTAGSPPAGWWDWHQSPGTTRYLYADATINAEGTVTAAKLQFAGSAPTTGAGNTSTGAPPAHAYRKLFRSVVDNDYVATITQYTKGAQQAVVHVSADNCTSQTKGVYWLGAES